MCMTLGVGGVGGSSHWRARRECESGWLPPDREQLYDNGCWSRTNRKTIHDSLKRQQLKIWGQELAPNEKSTYACFFAGLLNVS